MKQYLLNYRTNVAASIIGCDTIEEGKAIIEILTMNATVTASRSTPWSSSSLTSSQTKSSILPSGSSPHPWKILTTSTI